MGTLIHNVQQFGVRVRDYLFISLSLTDPIPLYKFIMLTSVSHSDSGLFSVVSLFSFTHDPVEPYSGLSLLSSLSVHI